MRHVAAVLVLALAALPAAAGFTPCSQAMVDAGLCGATTDVLLHYAVPDDAQADFVAAYAEAMNYQETVPCGSERLAERGVLIQAGPGDGTCTPGRAGQEVANPQGRAAAVDRYVRNLLADEIREYRVRERVRAEEEAAEAEVVEPALGGGR